MKKNNPYWTFFKHRPFRSKNQRGRPFPQNKGRLFLMSLLIITINGLFMGACKNDTSSQLGVSSNRTSELTKINSTTDFTIKVEKPIRSFLAQEPSITNFYQMMNDIHSLKTLTKIKSKQLILFVPEDAAFEKLGKEEKEKLLDKAALKQRHQLFKNSLVIHDKNQGTWNGLGETYGNSLIQLNTEAGTVSFDNSEARILKQVMLKGGHLLYIIDTIIT